MSKEVLDAVSTNQIERLSLLLQSNQPISIEYKSEENGYTLLHWAVLFGNHPMVCLLVLYSDKNQKLLPDNNNLTALEFAAKKGEWACVEKFFILLEAARIPQETRDYCLHQAVLQNNVKMALLLLRHDANIAAQNKKGKTMLEIAADKQFWNMVSTIIPNISKQQELLPIYNKVLQTAVLNNQKDIALLLQAKGANIFQKNENEELTLLELVAEKGFWDIVQVLVTGEAKEDYKTDIYGKLLFIAIEKKKPEMVSCLLAWGANKTSMNANGYTPIQIASRQENWPIVKRFTQYPTDKHDKACYGSALLIAITKNQYALGKELITAGASLNRYFTSGKHKGYFALHIAVLYQEFDLVTALIKSGANPDAYYNENSTPLALAFKQKDPLAIITLLQNEAKPDYALLLPAAKEEAWALVQGFIENLSDSNKNPDVYGQLLHLAIEQSNKEMIVFLSNHGANKLAKNEQNNTPIVAAASMSKWDLVELLIQHNVSACEKTEYGRVLHMAIDEYKDNSHIIQCLLEYDADRSVKNANAKTPIIVAAEKEAWELVDCFANYSTDDTDHAQYAIALFYTVKNNRQIEVENLLKAKAPTNYQDPVSGFSLLHLAIFNDNLAMLKLLLAHNASKTLVNKQHKTPKEYIYERIRVLKNPQVMAQALNFNLAAYEAQQFAAHRQNTHQEEVELSIRLSLQRLLNHYGKPIDGLKIDLLSKIFSYLTDLKYDHQYKAAALSAYKRIISEKYATESYFHLTFSDVLVLVWRAINDEEAKPEGVPEVTEEYITLRRESLVEKLHETEKGTIGSLDNSRLCFHGTMNKMLESLNHAHPLVKIITGHSSVMSNASESVPLLIKEELQKESLEMQRKILYSWDDLDDEMGSLISEAENFRQKAAPCVEKRLKDIYGKLLRDHQCQEIMDNFEYIGVPIMHEKLYALQQTILKLSNSTNDILLKQLKDSAKKIRTISYQEEFEFLKREFVSYQALCKLTKKINAIENSNCELSRYRLAAVQFLVNYFNEICLDRKITFADRKEILYENYEEFIVLDKQGEKLANILPSNLQGTEARETTFTSLKTSMENAFDFQGKKIKQAGFYSIKTAMDNAFCLFSNGKNAMECHQDLYQDVCDVRNTLAQKLPFFTPQKDIFLQAIDTALINSDQKFYLP